MVEALIAMATLISGMALLIFSSNKVVDHSVKMGSILRMSPLLIGLLIVSLGTDLPEITNSIISSARGHGNINVGDSLGSVLVQISLILGIYPFLGGKLNIKRKEIIVIGALEVATLMLALWIVGSGHISRMSAALLVISWPVALLIARKIMKKEFAPVQYHYTPHGLHHHLLVIFMGFVGVAIASYVVVESVITLSAALHIHEYIISFFLVAIGTSLPELTVDLMAIRKKQYEIAIGDTIGSCIVDASFSIGIGPLFFPTAVSAGLAGTTGLYTLFVSIVILSTLVIKQKIDRKVGAFFILLYLFSYVLLYL